MNLSPVGWLLSVYNRYIWRRVPGRDVKVRATGGGTYVDFTATVSETRNLVPAMNTTLIVEMKDEPEPLFVSEPFNLAAGEVGRQIGFHLERPSTELSQRPATTRRRCTGDP